MFGPQSFGQCETFGEIARANTSQPELVCSRCQPLEDLVKRYEADMVEMGQEIQRLEDELAGRERQLRREGATVVALQRKLDQTRQDDPENAVVKELLRYWMRVTGREDRRGRKPNVDPSGERGERVKKALRWQNIATGQRYTAEDLMMAFDGLALKPYVDRGRTTTGTKAQRFDEVEHCLKDQPTIDRFIGYWLAARERSESDPEALWAWMQRKQAEALVATDAVLDTLARRDCPELVVGLDDLEEELKAVAA